MAKTGNDGDRDENLENWKVFLKLRSRDRVANLKQYRRFWEFTLDLDRDRLRDDK